MVLSIQNDFGRVLNSCISRRLLLSTIVEFREGRTISDELLVLKAPEYDAIGAFVELIAIVLHGIEENPEVSDEVLVGKDTKHEVVSGGIGNEAILGFGEMMDSRVGAEVGDEKSLRSEDSEHYDPNLTYVDSSEPPLQKHYLVMIYLSVV
ncbi:hypothetical protein M5K25_008372 [Dendrobium thyrsiflorum]|uniref:Uncharacterized protein n=1 Tax=Dendrobium thyrsiflorum TaxID=117978 RepID=A0ABD0VFB1_DENTH